MAKELVEQRVLIGKNEQEIETMLGPPATAKRFERYDRAYWLSGHSHGTGSRWLAVRFEDGKVVEAAIVEG